MKAFPVSKRLQHQKVVTFYRSSTSILPELRMIINSKVVKSLDVLMEELTRALSLKEHEKQIFKSDGGSLVSISDFEDGGSYFFSSDDTERSSITGAVTVIKESEESSLREKTSRIKRRDSQAGRRMIKVITTENSAAPWTVLLDEKKLNNFSQFLYELNRIIQPVEGRVFSLCTNKGRKVRMNFYFKCSLNL